MSAVTRQFTPRQTRAYWRALGEEASTAAALSSSDQALLEAVCHPGMPGWFNRYIDHFQHRAFTRAVTRLGDLDQKTVLDVGCGFGRWSKRLRDRGARVIGVDIAESSIALNRRRISGVDFKCGDVVALDVPSTSVDLAISVTVLQHISLPEQQHVVARFADVVRPGGHVLVMEHTKAVGGIMFSRSAADWITLFRRAGFEADFVEGYSYDLVFRAISEISALVRRPLGGGRRLTALQSDELARYAWALRESGMRRVFWNVVYRPFVPVAYVTEALSGFLPPRSATHVAILFRRISRKQQG